MNRAMFSSKTDLWETPQELFGQMDAEFHFNLDVCALPENAKCAAYYTPEQDGLKQPWYGRCWCNPPYGRQVGKWVEKAYMSAQTGALVVMLLPARTDTAWFHDYIYRRAEIRFIRGLLKFGGSKNGAPFPSMVVVFRPKMVDYSKIIETLEFATAALRPVSREQVEKVWRGEWNNINHAVLKPGVSWVCRCAKCGCPQDYKHNFCPNCGAAQTDEAVDMVMERLEAPKDGKGD